MTYHDKVKRKIQELVPDIMRLDFGCEISHKKDDEYFIGEQNRNRINLGSEWYGKKGFENQKYDDSIILRHFDIVGRAITLADIFKAFLLIGSKKRIQVFVESSGQFRNDVTHLLGPQWNLEKDFDHQSPELKDFIGSLLNVEK